MGHYAEILVRQAESGVCKGIQCNQYVTMFLWVIMLKFLSDKQNLVFVRVYSQVSSMRYKLTCTCRKDSNQYEHPQNLIRVLVFHPK